MSTLTILCFVDGSAPLLDRLTAEFSDCSVRQTAMASAAAACVEQLVASGDEVALTIAASAWLGTRELQAVCDHFPQALMIVLDDAAAPAAPVIEQPAVYRRLPYPGSEAELVFTVSAALGYYRQGQQLILGRAALAEAHQQLTAAERQMSTLSVQLDWGVSCLGDRVQAEQTLRRSQRSLAEAQRIAHLGSWEFDLASQTIIWSAEMHRIYGLDPTQPAPSYDQWRQTIPTADWPPLEAAIERAIATGAAYEVEHRIVRSDGAVRYVLARGEAVYNDQGQVVQLQGTGQDRTDARLAELALAQSEARNRAILLAVPDLMAVMSAEGQCLDFSPNGFTGELVPLAARGPVEATGTEVLPAEVARQWLETIAQTLATGTTQFFEQQLSFGDRTQYEVVRMVPYQTDQVLVLVRDISDRKRAEAALQHSQEQLSLALNLGQMAVWDWDVTSDRITWNDIAYDLLGQSISSLGLTYQDWLAAVHPDDRAASHAAIQQALADRQPFTIEYRVLWPDGTQRWIADRGQAVYSEGGEIVRAAGVMYDITPRKTAEAALQASEARFRQLAETVQEGFFVFDVLTQRYEYVNSAYLAIRGAALETFDGLEKWLTRVHPDDRDRVAALVAQELQGEAIDYEYRFLHPSRELRWLRSQGFPIANDAGVVVRIVGTVDDITERKRTELALEQAEERYRRATQAARTGVWELDLKTQKGYLDPNVKALVGYDNREVADSLTDWLELVHPDDQAPLETAMQSYFSSEGSSEGAQFSFEYRMRHRDGSVIWVLSRGELHRDADGQPEIFLGTTTDITTLKQAELALKQLNEELEQRVQERTQTLQTLAAVVENSTDLIATASLSGTALYLNWAGRRLVGLEDVPVDGQHISTLHTAETRLRLEQEVLPAVMAAGVWRGESAFCHAQTGEAIAVEQTVFLVKDPDTQVPLCLATICRDIRDRRRSELALQESRNMLKLILDTIPQRVFWKDRHSRFLGCNPAFANDYGLTPENVIGITDAELPWASYAAEYQAEDRHVMTSRQPKLGYEDHATTIGGKPLWLLTSKVPLTNADDVVIGVLGCYEDITARKQVEASLLQLNQELEQRVQERTWELEQAVAISAAASRAKSTFLANMSHELRTPLNAILGFAQLMARDPALSADHQRALSIVNRSGEHLLMLINDILEMAKIEAGQVNLNASSFDLDALLSTLSDMFCLRAQNKGLTLSIDRHPALPRYFRLDAAKLRQVLINLLGNAIKFTAQGQVTLRVAPTHTIAAAPPPPGTVLTVTFTVSDTGIGLAAADRDRLFEPFVQASQGAIGGTGLGLSISRQFVQMLGGDITVESEQGQGATFAFTLPLPVVEAANEVGAHSTNQVIAVAAGQPCYRLLVVDDNEDHRYLLSQLLQSVGFEVREATNGEEAIALWQSWQPQLIWLDMRMPVLNGYEAAQAIRNQEQGTSQTPTVIIALTANAFEDDRARALDNGCDDFVRKPFQTDQLLAKLTKHLGVQYAYGPSARSSSGPPPLSNAEAIALLRTLSDPVLDQIQQATLQLNSDQLTQIMAQFTSDQTPLTTWLDQQINDFAFDTIHTLVQQAKSEA